MRPNRQATSFDVAVVGAGPAGSATARWLALRGCRVALIERTSFEGPRIGESLGPAVQPLLRELGVWNSFSALAPLPSWGTRSVWGTAEEDTHSHLLNAYGCGWHIDRRAFDEMLARAAVTAGAVFLEGTILEKSDEHPHGPWKIRVVGTPGSAHNKTILSQKQLEARVLVDATGRRAQLARVLGAQRLLFDGLVGISTQWSGVDAGEEGHLLVETDRQGWWYSAPVPARASEPGGGMMVMLMTDYDLCTRARLTQAPTWHAHLQATGATHRRLAGARCVSEPRVHCARSHRLQRERPAKGSSWLAVGDAALAVDPISGSGIVRALRTARLAAETTMELLECPTPDALEAYEVDRDRDCTQFLSERAAHYALEHRWQDSSFWQRRLAAACREHDHTHSKSPSSSILRRCGMFR